MKARQMSKISQDFNKHSEMISPRNADSEQPIHIKRCMIRPRNNKCIYCTHPYLISTPTL